MNKLYKIFPNRSFSDNWSHFNSIYRAEVKYYYMEPIESILLDNNIDLIEKIEKINVVVNAFLLKKEELHKWSSEIIELFIHNKER